MRPSLAGEAPSHLAGGRQLEASRKSRLTWEAHADGVNAGFWSHLKDLILDDVKLAPVLNGVMLSRHPSPFSLVSLGPHVELRMFEISKSAFVPVAASMRHMVATLDHTDGIEFDDGSDPNKRQNQDRAPISIVLMQDGEQGNATKLTSLIETFEPNDFVIVFCLKCVCPISILTARPVAALFTSNDLSDILLLVRQIRSPVEIGIDLSDLFSIWSNRVSVVQSIPRQKMMQLARYGKSAEGMSLSFPKDMSLLEMDTMIDELKDLLPSSVELVWRNGGEQPSQWVDVCISRRLPNSGSGSSDRSESEVRLKRERSAV